MRVGRDWLLTAQRAAIHEPTATAVVADLHLGYGQARRRSGEAVPASDLDEIQGPLCSLAIQYGVSRLVIAGDLFEDARAAPLWAELVQIVRSAGLLLAGIVPGNHDRGFPGKAPDLPIYLQGFPLGEWLVVHGDAPAAPGRRIVQGHLHPCFRWRGRVAAPCYLIAADRIILPAFSADAAGVSVLRQAVWATYRCGVIAGEAVLDFGPVGDLRKRMKHESDRR